MSMRTVCMCILILNRFLVLVLVATVVSFSFTGFWDMIKSILMLTNLSDTFLGTSVLTKNPTNKKLFT